MRIHTLYAGLFVFSAVLMLAPPVVSVAAAPQSAEAKQTVSLVEKAVAFIEMKGKAAFPEFRKQGSEWYTGERYVLVDTMQGISLVNPTHPEMEGINILDLKDIKGKPFIREIIAMLQDKDSGWLEYMWPKPGQTKPSRKVSYFKKVPLGEETLIVGSGLYTD
jgi:cytochrome c